MNWETAGTTGKGTPKRREQSWGERELSTVALGDKRLEQRLKVGAEVVAAQPPALSNQARADWATKAAYRLFANPKASEQKIFAAHRACTVQRRQGQPVVFAIQDTSYLNDSHHP